MEQATAALTTTRAAVDRLSTELTGAVDDRILVAMCNGHVLSSLWPDAVVDRVMLVYCNVDVHPRELGAPPTGYGELGMIAFTQTEAIASFADATSNTGFEAVSIPFGVGTIAVVFEVPTVSETVRILEVSSGGRHHRFAFPPVAAIDEVELKKWIAYATSHLHSSVNHFQSSRPRREGSATVRG